VPVSALLSQAVAQHPQASAHGVTCAVGVRRWQALKRADLARRSDCVRVAERLGVHRDHREGGRDAGSLRAPCDVDAGQRRWVG